MSGRGTLLVRIPQKFALRNEFFMFDGTKGWYIDRQRSTPMTSVDCNSRRGVSADTCARLFALLFAIVVALALIPALPAQQTQPSAPTPAAPDPQAAPATQSSPAPSTDSQPSPAPDAAQQPEQQPGAAAAEPAQSRPAEPAPAAGPQSSKDDSRAGGITEEELRHMLVGKSLYLRGGYLDNSLEFDERGQLVSHSPQGSYTLCGIEVDKVRLTKHKVELDGARYGLHFLGALPYEDPTKAVDRVKITPKKKFVRITIDREQVITPKKKKEKEKDREKNAKTGPGGAALPAEAAQQPTAEPVPQPNSATASEPASDATEPANSDQAKAEATGTVQAKAETAAAAGDEPAAAPGSVTTTTSPAHAARVLKEALDKIFSEGLDERMMAAMPDFWKLYYEAAAAHTDYRPADPSVLRQGQVEQKAKLVSVFQPESNDFAQNAGVAGMSLYHAVIGADGRPEQIAVARPIGFGLDESAVAAIRKASFQPAIKDGKPVPVLLDLVVEFRIYSKRTNVPGQPEDPNKPKTTQLPGPYTLQDSTLRAHDQAQSQPPNPPQSH